MKLGSWKVLGAVALIGLLAAGFTGCAEKREAGSSTPELTTQTYEKYLTLSPLKRLSDNY